MNEDGRIIDKKLQKLTDNKFLTVIGIMAMLNVMLITWQPFIEIPLLVLLIILNVIFSIKINHYIPNVEQEQEPEPET